MIKFIKNIFWFLLFVILSYPISLFIYGRSAPSFLKSNLIYQNASYGHMFSRMKEAKNIKDIDVLFIGSSHAYRGFDTRIFSANGISSFNMGSSAQTPVQTKVLLNRHLTHIKPKLIVYEVCPPMFLSDGIESSLDIISNEKNDIYSLQMTWALNHVKTYNTFLYALICDFFNLNSSIIEEKIFDGNNYISGGFVEKQMQFEQKDDAIESNTEFYAIQLNSFKEILALIKEKNIKLILVNAPIKKLLYNSYPKNFSFDSLMNTYSSYYNFNKIIDLNDSLHFYNADHLNKKGVQIFDQKLIELLRKEYLKSEIKVSI